MYIYTSEDLYQRRFTPLKFESAVRIYTLEELNPHSGFILQVRCQ